MVPLSTRPATARFYSRAKRIPRGQCRSRLRKKAAAKTAARWFRRARSAVAETVPV